MSDGTESERPAERLDPSAFTPGEKFVGVAGVVLFVGGALFAGFGIRSGQQCMATTPDGICATAYVVAALFGAPPALIGLLMSLVVVWRRSRRLPAREDDATAPWRQVHRRPPDQGH